VKRNVIVLALALSMTGCAGCPTNPPFRVSYVTARSDRASEVNDDE
jgi:hypothetical protein